MTYDEITLFGRFLQDKSMQKNFAYFYENHRFDKRSLEEFLEQVDAEDAILSAFDLAGAPNTIFSPKYWQGLNDKWMKRLAEFRDEGERLDRQAIRCEHCGRMMPYSSFALNSKGQLHKHCRECESGEWDRKRKEEEARAKEQEKREKDMKVLEKEIAEKQAKLDRLAAEQQAKAEMVQIPSEAMRDNQTTPAPPTQEGNGDAEKTTKVCDHCGQRKPRSGFDESVTSPDGLQSWCRECQADAVAASDEAEVKSAPKLGEYDATMHYKANEKRIVFNGVLSAQIKAAGLTKCYLSTERDGSQFLVFNGAEGANVTWAGSKTSVLAQVCSSSTCRQIAERYRLALGDNYYLHITKNLSHQNGIINVGVKQVRSREEYAAIAARREEKARLVPGRDVPEYEGPDEEEHVDAPLIEFAGTGVIKVPDASVTSAIPLSGRKPADLLQQLVDRGHLAERDIAKFLYDRGWKLQEPVVVTTHKKFKA